MSDLPDFEAASTAVLVVDVTRSLADPDVESSYDQGVAAASAIATLLDTARDRGLPVYYSKGGMAYYTSEGADVADVERAGWPLKNDRRDEPPAVAHRSFTIAPQLGPREDEVVITKHAPSAFFGTMLGTYLATQNVETLVVGGMTTSGCVRASVTDAFSHGLQVLVPRECVADVRPDAHDASLEDVDRKYGFVTDLEAVTDRIEPTATGTP